MPQSLLGQMVVRADLVEHLAREGLPQPGGADWDALAEQYRFLRRVSLGLRLFGTRPSDTLEVAGSNPARLAKTLDYPSRKDFLDDYRRRVAWVRALYDRVVPR